MSLMLLMGCMLHVQLHLTYFALHSRFTGAVYASNLCISADRFVYKVYF